MLSSDTQFLTTNDETRKSSSGLMFCVAVDEKLLHRSGVLQALCEASGSVSQLPPSIDSAAFTLWATHDPHTCELSALTLDQLVAIVQVSDLLADSELTAWMRNLSHVVLNIDWKKSSTAVGALLSLPRQLLTRMMGHTERYRGLWNLQTMLESLPIALHGAAISSQVGCDGSLSMYLPTSNPLLVAGLNSSQLELPGRGLLRLNLRRWEHTCEKMCDNLASANIATLLGSAITSHTSLTSLTLASLLESEAVIVCKKLPDLTHLTHLAVHVYPAFTTPALTALSQALWQLTQLESMVICDGMSFEEGNYWDVHGNSHRPASQGCIQALASATRLTKLTLAYRSLNGRSEGYDGGYVRLKCLALSLPPGGTRCHEVLDAMPHLTALTLCQHPFGEQKPEVHSCHDVSLLPTSNHRSLSKLGTAPTCRGSALQYCLKTLPGLQHLHLTIPYLREAPPSYKIDHWSACSTSLTSITLEFEDSEFDASVTSVIKQVAEIRHLRSLKLTLSVTEDDCGDMKKQQYSFGEAVPFPPQLTKLTLCGDFVILRLEDTLIAMMALRQLEHLKVEHASCSGFEDILRAVPNWRALSFLHLSAPEYVDAGQMFDGNVPDSTVLALCASLQCLTQLDTLYIELLFSATHLVAICDALRCTAVVAERSISQVSLWYEYTEADLSDHGTGDEELGNDGEPPIFEAMHKAARELKGMVKQLSLENWSN